MCDKCGPAWNRALQASKIEILNEFKGRKGHYIKTFLINSEINFNGWMATKEAIAKNAEDFRGLPLILWWNKERKVWDHPEYNSKDEALKKQEEFRVGTIMDVTFDERTGNWSAITLIHNEDVWKKIESGELKYTSPSVWPKKIVEGMSNPLVTTDFWALHNAIVSDPAFGIATANVKGFCEGDQKKCLAELGPMVASIDDSLDHVRTIPFLKSQKSSDIVKDHKTNSKMQDEENKEFKKQIDALKAEIDDLKKKQQDANTEEENNDNKDKPKEGQKKGNEESEKPKEKETKQESSNEETDEQKKEKQQSAAVIELAKKPIINKILSASKRNGATESQLKEQQKILNAATIPELQNYETMFVTPGIQTPQESAEFPQLGLSGSLDASTDDVSDNEILEAI